MDIFANNSIKVIRTALMIRPAFTQNTREPWKPHISRMGRFSGCEETQIPWVISLQSSYPKILSLKSYTQGYSLLYWEVTLYLLMVYNFYAYCRECPIYYVRDCLRKQKTRFPRNWELHHTVFYHFSQENVNFHHFRTKNWDQNIFFSQKSSFPESPIWPK